MVKSKGYVVNEAVINTFLHLRLKDELAPLADKDGDSMKGKKRSKTRQHISKKQRKVMKENKEVEKELREAEVVVTKEEKEKTVCFCPRGHVFFHNKISNGLYTFIN